MKEKPILFSTEMVKAIIEGRKTQTRRIIKPQPKNHNHLDFIDADWKNDLPDYINTNSNPKEFFCRLCGDGIGMDGHSIYKSKYQKGDILWVRETFWVPESGFPYFYKATLPKDYVINKWKPSIFMPKEAARIWLEVINVCVERLEDISEEDAIAEGIEIWKQQLQKRYRDYTNNGGFWEGCNIMPDGSINGVHPAIASFRSLWAKINGFDSLNSNPWVWKIEFKIHKIKN